ARQDHRSGFRLDERRYAADVDRFRRFLFRATISGRCAALHQGFAIDRGNRCVAREYVAGRESRSVGAADRRAERLAYFLLHSRAETFSLALTTSLVGARFIAPRLARAPRLGAFVFFKARQEIPLAHRLFVKLPQANDEKQCVEPEESDEDS